MPAAEVPAAWVDETSRDGPAGRGKAGRDCGGSKAAWSAELPAGACWSVQIQPHHSQGYMPWTLLSLFGSISFFFFFLIYFCLFIQLLQVLAAACRCGMQIFSCSV